MSRNKRLLNSDPEGSRHSCDRMCVCPLRRQEGVEGGRGGRAPGHRTAQSPLHSLAAFTPTPPLTQLCSVSRRCVPYDTLRLSAHLRTAGTRSGCCRQTGPLQGAIGRRGPFGVLLAVTESHSRPWRNGHRLRFQDASRTAVPSGAAEEATASVPNGKRGALAGGHHHCRLR